MLRRPKGTRLHVTGEIGTQLSPFTSDSLKRPARKHLADMIVLLIFVDLTLLNTRNTVKTPYITSITMIVIRYST